MDKEKSFSLILATYGRKEEIENFIEALLKSDYDLKKVELIVVDQNDIINLGDITDKYKDSINLKHIKSKVKGLSRNRNIGLKIATGEIVAFPDDDCEYLSDTLKNVSDKFYSEEVDMILGRIVERDGRDSLRKWSKKKEFINRNNFYKKCSSITIFYKKEKFEYYFDENLGVGAKFGACEDADFIYKKSKDKKTVLYNPAIKIYHPHYEAGKNMNTQKIESYGLGFGGMIKKNLDRYMISLFIKAEIYHFLKVILYSVKGKKENALNSLVAFKSRLKGFKEYGN